jgi:uncharacterized membrane protein YraQ (UPF0718 family)
MFLEESLTRPALAPLKRLDRVLAAMALILAALLVLVPAQAVASLGFTIDSLIGISPFLVGSVLVAAGIKATGLNQLAGRVFQGRTAAMIVIASVFGALSPFCSCGVIPLIAALLAAGVPLAPVMAFWIASPIMDPELFILTASGLDLEFAMAKTMAAIALGLFSGFATFALQGLGGLRAPTKARGSCGGCGAPRSGPVVWAFWREPVRRTDFAAELRDNGFFLGKWMAFAFLLESLMLAYLPADSIGLWLGADSAFAIPAAVLVGVPAYLNGYAAIPTVAGLIEMGMAPAAGLAFMTAGAVTSLPAAIAVYAVVRRPVFAWYVLLAVVGSTAVGYGYQAFLGL